MTSNKRSTIKFLRQQQLIAATLEVIDKVGLAETTMLQIAKQAGMSSGIISHYFGDKNGLITAVMQHIMQDLHAQNNLKRVRARDNQQTELSLKSEIRAIIDVNLSEYQLSGAVVKTWLAFWASSMHQNELKRLNKINQRRLLSNLTSLFGRQLDKQSAKMAAIGLATMIEGIWLRKALSGEDFDLELARNTAYRYVDQQLSNTVTTT